jgi:hypothetical protein
MKWIKAEGVNFKYIFPNDDIMKEEEKLFKTNAVTDVYNNISLLRGRDLSFDIYKILQNGVNTRLAIFKRFRNRLFEIVPYCIVWPDGDVDLTKLDKKVENDCFNDADFSSSIRVFVQRIFCRNCKVEYIGLIVDYSDPYLVENESSQVKYYSVYELLDNKLKKHDFKKCPNCNSPFTIYVAKILYKCEDKNLHGNQNIN